MSFQWREIRTEREVSETARALLAKHSKVERFISIKIPMSKGAELYAAKERGFFHCYGSFIGFTLSGYEAAVFEVIRKNDGYDYRFGPIYELLLTKTDASAR